jgi:hypothetical protein
VRFRVEGLRNGDSVRLSAYVRRSIQGGSQVALEVISSDGRMQKPVASSVDTKWVRALTEKPRSNKETPSVVLSSPPTQLAARAGLPDP